MKRKVKIIESTLDGVILHETQVEVKDRTIQLSILEHEKFGEAPTRSIGELNIMRADQWVWKERG